MIFMYFFHLIYIFSTFIFIFTFGGDAGGGVTGIVELKDRGLMGMVIHIFFFIRKCKFGLRL